jgi:hypothetical protein
MTDCSGGEGTNRQNAETAKIFMSMDDALDAAPKRRDVEVDE